MSNFENEQENAVKRIVGIVTLRRLHRLANEENAQQRKDALWAFRIGITFVAVLALILLVSLLRH
ncbi:MAG: hypothetical protein IPJ38_14865 [Dechloromonas sp.]|jgi:hypothetical protein|uniref:Uncharacterized protein n=1 Tax=Candidatus Dechloromonas phosphorivorans TaxID=2899244 RepID=A0A935MRN5_9RHOO|nr:hypothetical protein [Candidatus Dechloromonas phosphorivorans]